MARYGADDNTNNFDYQAASDGWLSSFVMPENGTLDSIVVYVAQKFSNPNYQVDLYEGGTGEGDPEGATLVYDSGEQSTPASAAWETVTASSESLTSGTRYWIQVRLDGSTNLARVTSTDSGDLEIGSPSGTYRLTAAPLPGTAADATFPSGATNQSYTTTIKAAINYSASSGQTGTGTPSAQAATVTGSGNKASSATGTPASQAAQASGAGQITKTGSGTPAAEDSAASGVGIRIADVDLVLTAAQGRELKDAAGTLVASLSNIVWEWYDTPGSTAGEPIDSGTFNTDVSGEATITVTNSELADGEFGQLIIYHPSDPLIRASLRIPVTD